MDSKYGFFKCGYAPLVLLSEVDFLNILSSLNHCRDLSYDILYDEEYSRGEKDVASRTIDSLTETIDKLFNLVED